MSIVQNDTSPIIFALVLSSDHVSAATGKTATVTLSKNGGAFAAGGGTVTELANGFYKYTPVTADVGTLGDLAIRATATSCDDWQDIRRVVQAGAAASDWTSARAAKVDNLDVASSTLATATNLAAAKTVVDAVKTKTDNLPTDPADESLLEAAITATQNMISALNNLNAAGVRAAIGLAAANLDAQLDALPTAAENATAVVNAATATPIAADIQKVNGVTIVGDGSSTPWGA